jgi:amino acid transporter
MGPAVGTTYGLITLLALALKSSFELIGMAAFTRLIVDIDIRMIAVSLCVFFIIVNLLGIKGAGRIQIALVFCIFAALISYIIHGLPNVRVSHFEPFAPQGLKAMFATAGFVFVSFGGLLKVASVAEEVKDPGRVLPLAMLLSLLVVGAFYTMVIFVTVGVLNPAVLRLTLTPVSDGAATFMGSWGSVVLSIVAVLAFMSATNAGIMGASRYPLALSRDDLLPKFLGNINARFKTPHYAILVTGILMIMALFLKLNILVKAASSILILTYIFPSLAIIILRESHLANYQPRFHAPLYPWIQIIGVIGFAFLLYEIGRTALLITILLLISGLFVYWFYGRIRAEREYALLHLIERITAKELTNHALETELKEIIRERDDIIKDRFDRQIERAVVLDIDRAITAKEFFKLAADSMAEKVKVKPDTLLEMLLQREKESSTVIGPGLAIPHIIIEGKRTFSILLARCKEGVKFSKSAPKVHAIFVLVGTRDERNFHLRTLAAIAQIVQDPHFEKRWMRAKRKEALRDTVLLGKRSRL